MPEMQPVVMTNNLFSGLALFLYGMEKITDRLLKHRVQVDLLDKMSRLFTLSEHMAISVLPRSILAGELPH